jgi:dihydropyrimidinase
VVVFDPKTKFTLTQKKLHMNVDYTPYEGMNVTGMPMRVYSRGAKVAEWDGDRMKFVGKPGRSRLVKGAEFFAEKSDPLLFFLPCCVGHDPG